MSELKKILQAKQQNIFPKNIYFLSKLTYTTDVISHVIKTLFLQSTLCDLCLLTFCILFILDGECKSVISFTKGSLHLFFLSYVLASCIDSVI